MGTLLEYKTLDDKKDFFTVKQTVKSKEEFDEFYKSLKNNTGSIWRGVPESKYMLYTSLQRFWIVNDFKNDLVEVEKYLYSVFQYAVDWRQNFLVKYFSNYGINDVSIYAVLSILRHNDAPTPLLDWTRNPQIGLFFGCHSVESNLSDKKIENYFSLYEIKHQYPLSHNTKKDLVEFLDSHKESLGKTNNNQKEDLPNRVLQALMIQSKYFFDRVKQGEIYKIEDKNEDESKYYINNNYNITNQDGLFIINAHPINPLEQAIQVKEEEIIGLGKQNNTEESKVRDTLKGHKNNFVCYNIHKSLKHYILKKLAANGIDEEYIFPNLKELSKECVIKYLQS